MGVCDPIYDDDITLDILEWIFGAGFYDDGMFNISNRSHMGQIPAVPSEDTDAFIPGRKVMTPILLYSYNKRLVIIVATS